MFGRKQKGMSMVGNLIGLMVVIIILINAVMPTVQSGLTTANFNGSTKTITDLIPLFLGIAGVVMVVAMLKIG